MGHHHHTSKSTKNLGIAFFLNLIFAILEFIGGFITNSVAITSDALHDFGDSISIGISWYFERIAKRKRNDFYSYGYKRFSLLGALINAFVLVIGSMIVLYESVPRLLHPQTTNAEGMFLLAILGILVNGIAVFRLRHETAVNQRMVMLHLLEDVLGWIAVLFASVFIYLFNIYILDPLLSIAITGYVLYHVFRNLKEVGQIILQAVPKDINISTIIRKLKAMPNVVDIHDLHVWSMDSDYNVLSMHVVITADANAQLVKEQIRTELFTMHIAHATLEVERQGVVCDFGDCD